MATSEKDKSFLILGWKTETLSVLGVLEGESINRNVKAKDSHIN